MKFIKLLKYLTILICLSSTILTLKSLNKRDNVIARNQAQNYLDFARLPYCMKNNSNEGPCPVCQLIEQRGFSVVHVESQMKDNIIFTMAVSANQSGEIVISFGGPKTQNVAYLQQIYANGMSHVPELNNLTIETEFWTIYSSFFRNSLLQTLTQLNGNYQKIVFVGHSFGGSIAIISAYDLVHNGIIQKSAFGPSVFTFGALKIGTQQLIHTIQSNIHAPIVRIRRGIDFFTLIPRCVYITHMSVWHCYRNYVSLVRTFPMFASYYMRYSPIIRRQLVVGLPQIVHHAQSYVNKPVEPQAKHGHHVAGQEEKEAHNLQNSNANQHKENTPQRHTELNSVLNSHHDKPKDHNYINQISEVFGHHDKKPAIGDSEHTGHANNNLNSQTSQSFHTQERLASNEPLPYISHKKEQEESHHHNRHHDNANLEEEERKKFSSHIPQAYTGLHAQSISNTHEHLNRSHGSVGGSSSMNTHSAHGHHMQKRHSFLETDLRVESGAEETSAQQDLFKTCETYGHYVSCKFTPEVHQIFFGVNIESCQ